MPRVPEYNQEVNVRPLDAPMQRPVSTDFSGLGRGIQQLGDAVGDIAKDRARIQADFDADLLDVEFIHHINERTKGDNGFLNKQGNHALSYDEDIQYLERMRDEISQKASNSLVREAFLRKAARRLEDTRARFDQHSYEQRINLYAKGTEALVQEAYREAADAPNAEGVMAALSKMEVDPPSEDNPEGGPGALVRLYHGVKGLDPGSDQMEDQLRAFYSKGLETAIRHKLSLGDHATARDIFDNYKDLLDKKVAPGLQEDIHKLEVHNEAFAFAKGVAEFNRGGELNLIDEEEAREMFQEQVKNLSPEVQLKAGQFFEEFIRQSQAARDASIKNLWKDVLNDWNTHVMANGNKGSGLNGVPADKLSRLSRIGGGEYVQRMLNAHRSILNQEQSAYRAAINFQFNNRQQTATDNIAYNKFLARTPEEILASDPESEFALTNVSPEAVSKMLREKEKVRRFVERGGTVPMNAFVQEVLASTQGFVTSDSAKEALIAQARLAYMNLDAEVSKKGRGPQPDEVKKLKDSIIGWSRSQKASGAPWIGKPQLQFQEDAENRVEALKENATAPHPRLGAFVRWRINRNTNQKVAEYERGVDFSSVVPLE